MAKASNRHGSTSNVNGHTSEDSTQKLDNFQNSLKTAKHCHSEATTKCNRLGNSMTLLTVLEATKSDDVLAIWFFEDLLLPLSNGYLLRVFSMKKRKFLCLSYKNINFIMGAPPL